MFLTREGARLFYREEGSGDPPLVFIHGGAVDHSTWDEHVAHFSPKHRCLAMDLRGHGDWWGASFPQFGEKYACYVSEEVTNEKALNPRSASAATTSSRVRGRTR